MLAHFCWSDWCGEHGLDLLEHLVRKFGPILALWSGADNRLAYARSMRSSQALARATASANVVVSPAESAALAKLTPQCG